MVEIQINLVEYIEKCCSFLRKEFDKMNTDLEQFFDELDRMHVCKVNDTSYKVGEMWKDGTGKWSSCKPGGVIEYDITPCTYLS